MPKLSSLPEELLCKISGFVHPGDVVSWAGTCKVLWRCSFETLETHKQRCSELRVIHDRNPITIPSLLRNSVSEPDILWYVRSFDIWDVREKFEEWESPRIYLPYENKGPEKHHDSSHLDSTFYTDEELERYRGILSEMLRFKQPLVNEWMERLRSGSDEPLKVLLMAMSPELKKTTIVCWNQFDGEQRSRPFRMLASTLRALAPLPSPQWPCFQNLKTVFVGHYTPLTSMDEYYHPYHVIAPLFLLPAIEKLHLNSLKQDSADENDGEFPKPYIWEWEKGRSSCQELTFEHAELAAETIASFIGATHSLRSISGSYGEDEIISALLEHSKHSLESVNFSHNVYTPVSTRSLQNFQQLTNITLPARHLLKKTTRMEWVDIPSFLPPMLQTLQIWLGSNLSTGFELFGHDTEGLIHQLVSLVNAKLSPANDAFTSLTLICLGLLYVNTRGRGSGDRRDGHDPLLKDLKRVCEKAKVEFHLGAPEGRKRHNCSFGRTGEAISLDSWPAMLDEENKSN